MSEAAEFFRENGYYHAKGVFDAATIAGLEADFDRIVAQLTNSGEDVDATWDSTEVRKIARKTPEEVEQMKRRRIEALEARKGGKLPPSALDPKTEEDPAPRAVDPASPAQSSGSPLPTQNPTKHSKDTKKFIHC